MHIITGISQNSQDLTAADLWREKWENHTTDSYHGMLYISYKMHRFDQTIKIWPVLNKIQTNCSRWLVVWINKYILKQRSILICTLIRTKLSKFFYRMVSQPHSAATILWNVPIYKAGVIHRLIRKNSVLFPSFLPLRWSFREKVITVQFIHIHRGPVEFMSIDTRSGLIYCDFDWL